MGQAKARKVEIAALKSNQMTAVEFIETMKKVVAEKYGWKDTYTHKFTSVDNFVLNTAIITLAGSRKVTAKQIQDAYPNEGTYTYTDGVVDYVLGAMHPTAHMLFV